jgi:hypothetical protein
MDTRVAAGGTLIRRYALALPPGGAGSEAAVTAASVPPLSGGPGRHGSEAAHAFTIANKGTRTGCVIRQLPSRTCQPFRSVSDPIDPEWLNAAGNG